MTVIDKIKQVLELNPNLNQEAKEVITNHFNLLIKSSVVNLNDLLPSIERLANLSIEKTNNYVSSGLPATYNGLENKLMINSSLVSTVDQNKVLIQQLLNIVTFKSSDNKIMTDRYQAFYDGYSSIVATNTISNQFDEIEEKKDYYFDESVMVNLLGEVVGVDRIEKSYYENNIGYITEYLVKQGVGQKEIQEIFSLMNHNQRIRHLPNQKSNLSTLQVKMINLAAKLNLNNNQIDRFKEQLIGIPELAPEPISKYSNLSAVYNHRDQVFGKIQIIDVQLEEKSR